jgi:hypothetical protein
MSQSGLKRRRLTVSEILRWAVAYRETTGRWPTRHSGGVARTIGETWANVVICAEILALDRWLPEVALRRSARYRTKGVPSTTHQPTPNTSRLAVANRVKTAAGRHEKRWVTTQQSPNASRRSRQPVCRGMRSVGYLLGGLPNTRKRGKPHSGCGFRSRRAKCWVLGKVTGQFSRKPCRSSPHGLTADVYPALPFTAAAAIPAAGSRHGLNGLVLRLLAVGHFFLAISADQGIIAGKALATCSPSARRLGG